jgi:outer membrane receptor protein involved in Fe transport
MLPARWRTGAELTPALSPNTIHFFLLALAICVARSARADEPPDGGATDAPIDEVRVRGNAAMQRAASDVTAGAPELEMRPRQRAEDVLEAVPGLFTVQHSGGAKAQQYFLRGFDADHGTDIAFSVDGVPLNAVSHAHGQGYTDLHFLIPELILSIEATKGPYSARVGDFATAGAVNLHLADRFSESRATLQMGPDAYTRGVFIESPHLGEKWRAIMAAELFQDDGHFVHPENHRRFNAYARLTRVLDDDSELSLTWMGYGASWNASGVIPARATCGANDGNHPPETYGAHCIDRLDSIDSTQGGGSGRMMGSASYDLHAPDVDLAATAYVIHSNLQLFLDETFFTNDPTGMTRDGIEQDDRRTVLGANVRVTKRAQLAGVDLATSVGTQARTDIVENALHDQSLRRRLDTRVSSNITESDLGAFLEEDFRPAPWIRFVLGARLDRADIAVDPNDVSAQSKASGGKGEALLSPKAMAIASPLHGLDVFVDYGRGFHSNDARGAISDGAMVLTAATGYEVGVEARPIHGLSLTAAAFLLDVASELVFDGNTATTAASGRTRREGIELTARYHFRQDIYADAALSITHARFRDDDGTGTYVPLAPPRTFAAGIGVRERLGMFTGFGSIRVKSTADRPATRDGTLTAQGFTLLDAQAGLRWSNVEVAIDVLNALDQQWREGQFAITSRLPYEPKPVTAMSFTPGFPREALVRATVYW